MHRLWHTLRSSIILSAWISSASFAETPAPAGRASKPPKAGTKHDFDGIDVSGARKEPMSSMLSTAKPKKDYSFVPIRRSWHPEIVESTKRLDEISEQTTAPEE